MSVRKREWTAANGELKQAWLVVYKDLDGVRVGKQFEKKKDADAFHEKARSEVRLGTHVSERNSPTVSEACSTWIEKCETKGLKLASVNRNRQHVKHYIKKFYGSRKLSTITPEGVDAFGVWMREKGKSPALINAVMVSFSGVFTSARLGKNPVRERTRIKRRKAEKAIPTTDEIRTILKATKDLKSRLILTTFATTGLRGGELRALKWKYVFLDKAKLAVRLSADFKNELSEPKSKAGRRTIPLLPSLVDALKQWKKECPRNEDGELDFVFPAETGSIQGHQNIEFRTWRRAQLMAGVTKLVRDDDTDEKIAVAKYTGLHVLRHFYASWCLSRKPLGLELPVTEVQRRLGHESIKLTVDTYGHLIEQDENPDELARADRLLLT